MSEPGVQRLLRDGVIRHVAADEQTARTELATARTHLESAETLSGSDPNAAFQLAYDGARKAIAAHMRASGYRIGSGQGAHAKTGQYASVALDDEGLEPHLDAFDDLRSLRNQSQYDAVVLAEGDVEDALDHARAIVEAVENDLE